MWKFLWFSPVCNVVQNYLPDGTNVYMAAMSPLSSTQKLTLFFPTDFAATDMKQYVLTNDCTSAASVLQCLHQQWLCSWDDWRWTSLGITFQGPYQVMACLSLPLAIVTCQRLRLQTTWYMRDMTINDSKRKFCGSWWRKIMFRHQNHQKRNFAEQQCNL